MQGPGEDILNKRVIVQSDRQDSGTDSFEGFFGDKATRVAQLLKPLPAIRSLKRREKLRYRSMQWGKGLLICSGEGPIKQAGQGLNITTQHRRRTQGGAGMKFSKGDWLEGSSCHRT